MKAYYISKVHQRRLILTISCLIFFFSQSICAQNNLIRGVVVDANTGNPIEGAVVKESQDRTKKTTLTNKSGEFSITTHSKKLIITHVSYLEKWIIVSKTTTTLYIELEPHEDVLDQIIVTGDKTEKEYTQTTLSVERLSPKLLNDKNPLKLDQIANQIPGIVVTDQQVSIRGGSGWSYGAGSRVMVIVDGTPLSSGDAGQVLWTFINMENIKRVEVVKGASSVVYGSSALNGVINIESAWAKSKPKTIVSLFSGTYSKPKISSLDWSKKNLFNTGVRAFHSRKIGKSDFIGSVDYLHDDGYRMSDFDNRLNTGLAYRYRGDSNWIVGFRSNYMQGESGSFLLWNSFDSGYSALNNASTKNLVTRFRFDPFYTIYGKKGNIHKLKTRFLHINNTVNNGDTSVNQSNTSNMYYVDYQWIKMFKKGFSINTGLVGSKVFSSSPLYNGDHEAGNAAAFIQFDKKAKKLNYNGGFRLEHYTLDNYKETKPVFRAGINYQIKKYTFLRASFGQGYRFPTIAESFISTTVGVINIFPNENLKSETGWNTEIGIKQALQFLGLKAFLDIALYRMEYNNMIEFTFRQWQPNIFTGLGFKSLNTGRTRIDGVEISMNGVFKRNLHSIKFLTGYNYNIPTSLNPNKVIAIDSSSGGFPVSYKSASSDTSNNILKYRNQHVFKFDLSYTYKRWDIGFSHRYQSSIKNYDNAFITPPISLFVPGIKEGSNGASNGLHISDLRLFYKINSWFRAGLIVNNALNTVKMSRPADLNAPRNIMVQLKVTI